MKTTKRSISFLLENKTNTHSSVYISFNNEITKTINETLLNKDFEVKVLNEEESCSHDYPNINKNNDFFLGQLTEEQSSFTTTLLRLQCSEKENYKKADFLSISVLNFETESNIHSRYSVGNCTSVIQQQGCIVDIVESNNLDNKNSTLFDLKKHPVLKLNIPANMKVYATLFGYINSEKEVLEKEEVLEIYN